MLVYLSGDSQSPVFGLFYVPGECLKDTEFSFGYVGCVVTDIRD